MPDSAPVDVAVVGGGPAGLATAAAAAAGGLRVTVLERGHAIGEPVRTSGGSFIPPLRRLGIPDRCWHPVHRIRVVGPTTEAVKHFRRPIGCVLDVRATYQWLAQRAVDAGAEIRLKTHVEGPTYDGTRITGVRVRGVGDLPARVVVDASGHTGFLAREAGLRPPNERSAVGVEAELHAPSYDAGEAVFWLGDTVAPGGYGWAFPVADGRVRVGIGVVRPESDADPRALLDLLLAEVRRRWGGPQQPIELHSGLMPVLSPTAATLVGDGLLSVGDAAGQGSTLLGEGIRYAIVAGRLAGDTLAAAGSDFSAARLASYPREWQRTMGRDLAISYAVNTRIVRYGDADWDRAIRRLDRLGARQAAHVFASRFSPWWAAGVVARDPGLVLSVARSAFRRTARGPAAAS